MIVEFHKCKFSTFCTTKRLEEKYQLIPNYWELNHLIAINVNLVLCTTKRLEEKYQLIPNYWELNVSFNCHKWNSAFFRICTLNKCIFIQIFCISNTDLLYFNTDLLYFKYRFSVF